MAECVEGASHEAFGRLGYISRFDWRDIFTECAIARTMVNDAVRGDHESVRRPTFLTSCGGRANT